MDDIKENEHITFDEMIRYFEIDQDNPDNILLVNKIRGHLCKCKRCKEDYDKINIFNSAVYDYARFTSEKDL